MHVLFLPDYGQHNPYQADLVRALGRYGVKVLSVGIIDHPLLDVVRARSKLDVLHLHWTSPFLISRRRSRSLIQATIFLLVLLWLKLIGVKIVWTVHNLTDHERQDPHLEQFFNRVLSRVCDQIIVHCSFAREAITRTYCLPDQIGARISVIPHGSFVETYANAISQGQARRRLGFGGQETIFLYFGKIRPYKGVLQLIDAFKMLENGQARLVIVGEPTNETIKAQLEGRCYGDERIHTYLEFVPEGDIQLYMNAASVVVLPFQNILTSGTLMLAMSFGKAIITPRLGCTSEVMDSQGGFIYDPTEEKGLLRAMRGALSADLTAMGQLNYERAKQFDWNSIARQTCEVYNRCLEQL
jgi:beta-1,4-mannosyltransferase